MKILIGLISALLFGWVIWRLASRRASIPCPNWLSWLVEMDNPFTKTNRAAAIVESLNLQPGMKVLDIGCGPGRITIPVAKAVGQSGEVVAMDIQAGMIQKAQKKVELANLDNVKFIHSDLNNNTFQRNMFDCILLVTVLGEIPDRESALQSIFSTLKPGGILSVTEIVFDPHFQRCKTVLGLAKPIGFKEKAFFGNSIAYTLHLAKPLHEDPQ